ncbi:DNA-binding transcriptional regulator, MarR family [Sediminibacillus albus]|uniref:DNA-binding transcriptional regulator, MarR family n=1 Tax=Sediminibacillus albus TaxID=407036 RepID=A0A1G9BRY9_9BACI|nr:DNA-binding transcriptional regulator, MarR family [Sediminibacillus albus]
MECEVCIFCADSGFCESASSIQAAPFGHRQPAPFKKVEKITNDKKRLKHYNTKQIVLAFTVVNHYIISIRSKGGYILQKTSQQATIAEVEKNLRYISGIIKQKGREILTHYPITAPQFVALQWLNEEGDLTIGELSNKINLAFSTTTDLVDRMEKNELVERIKDTSDRRVVRIHLLEKGKSIIQEVIIKRQEYLGEVLESVSNEEVGTLERILDLLHQQMKKVSGK